MVAQASIGFVLLALLAQCGASAPTSAVPTPSQSIATVPAFVSSPTAKPSPSQKPKPQQGQQSFSCPSPPLRGVYHPYRLHVLGTCKSYRGVVLDVSHEPDGDYHVVVKPDSGYAQFLNQDNYKYEHGGLVTEIMPGQRLPGAYVGEHVAVFGTWVLDANHGWREIHPVWAITNLGTGKRMFSLPVVPPRYSSASSGGSSGGGGGGGTGCSSSQGYYASSYGSAYLIYPASNPDWHSLSVTYLRQFCTLAAAEAAFPGRSVDTDG
jgi:hypothetical protein